MSFFQSLNSSKISYDDYIDSVLAGSASPQYTGISALKNSDVLTAVSIIAGDIARFPLIKKDLDGDIIGDKDINYLLNIKATKNASARTWKFAMAVNAILTGNSFSRVLRDPKTGKALEFQMYRPSETTVKESDNHEITYTFNDRLTGKEINCHQNDVVHWKFFSHDGILGRSPLLSLNDEISLQNSGTNTLLKFFKDGFSSGIIKLKGAQLNGEARKKARMDFEKMREGSTGGSPLIFDATQEYTPLEVDTNVLQLITSNNFSTAQIAKALRVPAYKLGVNSPNQSVAQLMADYVSNDLPFYLDAITSDLTLKVFTKNERKKYMLEFDTREVTGRNVDDVIKLVNNGIITPNQALVELGKQKSDDPNMDRYQSSLNYVFLDKKEKYQDVKGGDKNETNPDEGTTDSEQQSGGL
ncbi:phage portal protein [Streptococcus jiangjianxini]|uniref:phage portal protein n=1 Tax=Streptococcus jiangjianxini TaxID=3161189 RepID=UPI0032ED3931